MRFMVDHEAGMAKANEVDASGGPGPMLSKIMERFKPEVVFPKALSHIGVGACGPPVAL
jgi:hypothetical protein